MHFCYLQHAVGIRAHEHSHQLVSHFRIHFNDIALKCYWKNSVLYLRVQTVEHIVERFFQNYLLIGI